MAAYYQPVLSSTRPATTPNFATNAGSRCSGDVAIACSNEVWVPETKGASNAASLGTNAFISCLACTVLVFRTSRMDAVETSSWSMCQQS